MSLRVGIDVGGTFTDLAAFDTESGKLSVSKAPSTPDDPIRGVLDVIARASVQNRDIADLIHGTTVATNALLERKKKLPGLLTTKGFRDVVFLQRGTRQHLYDLQWDKPVPFVERRHCLEVEERINSRGEIESPLDEDDVRAAARFLRHEDVRDVAVSYLFAYLNPSHELLTREIILDEFPEASVSLSHEVYRRWREYDRTSTTLADAFLKTLVSDYVSNLAEGLHQSDVEGNFLIMKSNGGVEDHRAAAAKPVDLLVSGPVGGVLSAVYFGQLTERRNLISMDMGGTSLDVSLITDGRVNQTTEYELEWGLPVYTPMVDVKTIGAGGGSVAWIDKGGLLRVGPRSAGANPGPVCYGQGGTEPTVTDANLVLGRINPDYFLGGSLQLDSDAAARALERLGNQLDMSLEQVASAVIELVDANMANAIRVVSIDRGLDPRDFTLVSFGGAGSLHAASLAELIGIRDVLAPIHQGVFSAFGLTTADMRVDESVTANIRSDRLDLTEMNRVISGLETAAMSRIREEGFTGEPHITRAIEMRYYGQNYAVEVEIAVNDGLTAEALAASLDSYHAEHRRLYGYDLPHEVVEFINFTVTVTGRTEKPQIAKNNRTGRAVPKGQREVFFRAGGGWIRTPIYERDVLPVRAMLTGPLIVEEPMSTTLVHPGQTLHVDVFGNLVIQVPKAKVARFGLDTVDQVTLQVVNNYLVTTTREMGVAMRNTSYSPLFNEGLDFSCAVFDPRGEMLAQGDFCPSQLGAMKFVVEWTIAELGIETFRPGDVVFHNDPYRGGCHVPEYCVIKPIFFGNRLVGFAGNIGHMTETGGKSPGSFPGDSTDIFQEGIRIPPVKIIDAGQDVPIVWNIIMANVRTPRVSYGDLKALIGALNIGERRVLELVEKYGLDEYLVIADAIKDYAERGMRAELAEMPDGVYELEEYICDNDGLTPEPARLCLRITIDGDHMTVDYTGSDRQRRGPINCTYGVTAGATYNALLHLTDESIPANEGAYRPVRIIAPSGTIMNVEYPGALVGGNSEVHPHIVMAIYRALSEALPDRVSAYDGGTSAILTFGGLHPATGDVFVNLLNDGCGWGGRATKDGNTCLCIPNGNCALQAVEVLETRYPISHRALRIWENSAGAGKNRGGWGYIREFRIDCDEMTISMFMEREQIAPSGLFGGEDGPTSAILISQDGGKTFETFGQAFGVACNAKFSNVVLRRGDIIREMIPGGGGYGSPLERDVERIEEDLRQEYISADQAQQSYGVVIAPDDIRVDREATAVRRASLVR